MQAGEVALRALVVAGGDAAPGFQLVDQSLDSVPRLVEVGVVADGPTSSTALLLPVGGLVLFLRDDRLDLASSQIGAVAAGRVRLVPGDRVGPGAGTADRLADPHLLQHGDELRAVGRLPGGQDERQRAALAVGDNVDLAGLPAARAPEQGGLQPESVSTPSAAALLPGGATSADRPSCPCSSPPLTGPSPPRRQPPPGRSARPRRVASRRHRGGHGRWWSPR